MPLTSNDDLKALSYSILRGIAPMLHINEILNVRLLPTHTSNVEVSRQPIETDSVSAAPGFPSLIVRLSTSTRVRQIMSLKREINYYTTRDLDHSHLSKEFATRVPFTKIIINDVLPITEYQRFKSLRRFTKNLGFKYIWHRDGRFLARLNNGSQAHFFNNQTDLNLIKATHMDTTTSCIVNKTLTIPTKNDHTK